MTDWETVGLWVKDWGNLAVGLAVAGATLMLWIATRRLASSTDALRELATEQRRLNEGEYVLENIEATEEGLVFFDVINTGWKDADVRACSFVPARASGNRHPAALFEGHVTRMVKRVGTDIERVDVGRGQPVTDFSVPSGGRRRWSAIPVEPFPEDLRDGSWELRIEPVLGKADQKQIPPSRR